MEIQGSDRVIKTGTHKVPWNSMDLIMYTKLAHFNYNGGTTGVIELRKIQFISTSKEFFAISNNTKFPAMTVINNIYW